MSSYLVPPCECGSETDREYSTNDVLPNVVKGDSQIKLGHLALRNSQRMSVDEKNALYDKHNAYRKNKTDLPEGMKHVK
jgi:hypothetical protein